MTFDPRTLGKPVYEKLNLLRIDTNQQKSRLKEQKNQAVELYTYLSTWGMMRLKAEEKALGDEGKRQVVIRFFECLQEISGVANLSGEDGLDILNRLTLDEYLGLTGLGLSVAQEFSFWANTIYFDVKGET